MRLQALNNIELYLQEGLIAIIPTYTHDSRAVIITNEGQYSQGRSVHWLVAKIASHFSISLNDLRQVYGELLGVKHHITIPINQNLVLIPVKVRTAKAAGEVTIGYVSMTQVQEVWEREVGEEEQWLSQLSFKHTDYLLNSLNTAGTIREHLRQGDYVRLHYLKRREQITGSCYTGMSRKDLVAVVPNCDCLLLDMFRSMLHLKEDDV